MESLIKEYIAFLSSDESASKKFWKLEKCINSDRQAFEVIVSFSPYALGQLIFLFMEIKENGEKY